MSRVKQTWSRFTYPVAIVPPTADLRLLALDEFDLSSLRVIDRDGSDGGPVWEDLPQKELGKLVDHLVNPVSDYFASTGLERPVVRAFRWTGAALDRLGRDLLLERHGVRYVIRLAAIEMFVFDTGIALLALELVPSAVLAGGEGRPVGPDDVVEVNYALRSLGRQAARLVSARPLAAGLAAGQAAPSSDGEPLPARARRGEVFSLAELIDYSLEPVRGAGYTLEPISSQYLLGCTYLRVEPEEGEGVPAYEELAATHFRLRRLYSTAYLASPEMLSPAGNPEVFRPFENVVHGVAAEGMAAIVLDNGNPFFNEFGERYRRGYFALFLLAVHQRAALESLATRASRLPNLGRGLDLGFAPGLVHRVKAVRCDAFNFTLHHTFPWVGAVTMYQEVYERLMRAMRVCELHQDLRDDLREMDELLDRVAEQVQERSRRRLESIVGWLTPLMLVLTFWGANFTQIVGEGQAEHGLLSPWGLGSFVAAGVLSGLMYLRTRHRWRAPGVTSPGNPPARERGGRWPARSCPPGRSLGGRGHAGARLETSRDRGQPGHRGRAASGATRRSRHGSRTARPPLANRRPRSASTPPSHVASRAIG